MGTVIAVSDEALADLIADLTQRGLTIATAESLTGGGLVARLVDVPGASHVVRGGACTYAVDTKASVLGVSESQLAATGPVNEQVARQMARGARELFRADIGVSTTGVAGPGPADGFPPRTGPGGRPPAGGAGPPPPAAGGAARGGARGRDRRCYRPGA